MTRTCFYINESFAERNKAGQVVYHVALVAENVAGYMRIEPEPDEAHDLAAIQARCLRVNTELGLTDDDVRAIVGSSMAQGPVGQ